MVKFAAAAVAFALAGSAIAAENHGMLRTSQKLHNRQASASIMQSDYQNGATAPGARPGDAAGQTVVISNNGGHDDNSQRAECPTIFIGGAAVGGSYTTGWTEMPQVLGFDTKTDLTVANGVVQPYIVETGKNAAQIKRVVITQPGLPRDYWKYANLVRNSLLCASADQSLGINRGEILIAAPTWFAAVDANAGEAAANALYFNGGDWATGVNSAGPNGAAVSSFEALDDLVSKFFDKTTYPNVQQVVIAGHSLGGSFVQHYAMLRKSNPVQDPMMSYFVGNPGSYVWPTNNLPISNPGGGCASTSTNWGYGLQSLPPYGQGQGSADSIASRYYGRTIMYGLGLADNEGGDSHCEAGYQGTSHITRGQNFQRALQSANGGNVPSSQTFNFIVNVAHEDYLVFSDPTSQQFLFARGTNFAASASSSSAAPAASSTGKVSSATSAAGAKASSTGTAAKSSGSPSGSSYAASSSQSSSGSSSQSSSQSTGSKNAASSMTGLSVVSVVSTVVASSAAMLALVL